MDFELYKVVFAEKAKAKGYTDDEICALLKDAERFATQKLPIIYDQEHLARVLGFQLSYLMAMTNSQRHFYNTYKIPKQHGGYRQIDQPLPNLKLVQEWILDNILTPVHGRLINSAATAFMPGKSLYDHVTCHQGKKMVVALDLKDFFKSVKYYCVHDVFSGLGYSNAVATMLARLCTYRKCLPQGAPTSPMLSNMAFERIDRLLQGYCSRRGIIYTRYADDMTFSGDNINVGLLIRHVRYLIGGNYSLNEEKTKVMGQGNAQFVTGVVVNQFAQVPRFYRNRIRQEVYHIRKNGLDFHFAHTKITKAWINKPEIYLNHLIGKVNYVLQINPEDKTFVEYRRFLCGLLK